MIYHYVNKRTGAAGVFGSLPAIIFDPKKIVNDPTLTISKLEYCYQRSKLDKFENHTHLIIQLEGIIRSPSEKTKTKSNTISEFKLDLEVVRTKGDYVVGRIGPIIEIDHEKNRAKIDWKGERKTWVSFSSLAPTSIPYIIIPPTYDIKGVRSAYPQYIRLNS